MVGSAAAAAAVEVVHTASVLSRDRYVVTYVLHHLYSNSEMNPDQKDLKAHTVGNINHTLTTAIV